MSMSIAALFFRVTQMTHMFVFIEGKKKDCYAYATQNNPKIGLFRSWKLNKSVAFSNTTFFCWNDPFDFVTNATDGLIQVALICRFLSMKKRRKNQTDSEKTLLIPNFHGV